MVTLAERKSRLFLFGKAPNKSASEVPFFPGKVCIAHTPLNLWLDGEAKVLYHLAFSFNLEGVALAS